MKRHFYIITKPTGGRINGGIYPNYYDSSLQIDPGTYTVSVPENEVRSSFEVPKNLILADTLRFLETAVLDKILPLLNHQSKAQAGIIDESLRNIPVYLVTHGMCGKKTDKYLGVRPQEPHPVPPDVYTCKVPYSWDDLKKLWEKISWEEDTKTIDDVARDLGLDDKYRNCQILGCYEKDENIKNFAAISKGCRIFLWIDNIKDAANSYDCAYESLFFFVLCHELMHALMDVYGGPLMINGSNGGDKTRVFEEMKEESLANGLALYLLRNAFQFDFRHICGICRFVSNQSAPYNLGLDYSSKEVLELAVPTWMALKSGKKTTCTSVVDSWVSIVLNRPNKNDILQVENSFI